jgi:uncharacterized protein involved in response to NO
MQISNPSLPRAPAWLRLGFRPFFLAAGGFAVIAMLAWYVSYTRGWQLPFAGLSAVHWHAHEMVFGYSLAVVSGFLLTAVRNWTGIQTLYGTPLLLLFAFWLTARLLLLFGGEAHLIAAASFDLLFGVVLVAAITAPVVRKKLWANLAIVGKVALLVVSNLVFYLGVAGIMQQGVYWGLYSGLYLLVALIFTLSRRVLPFFIERGVGENIQLYNNRHIDIASLVLFLAFWIAELARPNGAAVALLAGLLFVLHLVRLLGWHHTGIWSRPLLWVLYLAYACMVAGFALKAAVYLFGVTPSAAVHAFAVGGIGLMTLGMMTRVALGHTGRDVFQPPGVLRLVFALLLGSALVRVLLPLLAPAQYALWVATSQWLWIAAFLLYLSVYVPILTRPRVDGQDG